MAILSSGVATGSNQSNQSLVLLQRQTVFNKRSTLIPSFINNDDVKSYRFLESVQRHEIRDWREQKVLEHGIIDMTTSDITNNAEGRQCVRKIRQTAGNNHYLLYFLQIGKMPLWVGDATRLTIGYLQKGWYDSDYVENVISMLIIVTALLTGLQPFFIHRLTSTRWD